MDIYNMNGAQMLFAGAVEADMTGTNTVRTDWIALPPECTGACIEALWDGNPNGSFFVEGAVNQKGDDLELSDIKNPDGTSHSGSLDAEDLDGEDLGISLINISGIRFSRIRLGYTNASGSGHLRARATGKKGE